MSFNPFAQAAEELKGQEIGGNETDSLGGRQLFGNGTYLLTITNFFQHKFDSGAQFIVIEGKDADGKVHRYQETVSNKAGSITYEKDGKKNFMPGYSKMNGIAMLAGRVELPGCTWEQKQVKLWSKAAGGEVLTPVVVAVNLIGKQVILGILDQTVNQTQKNEQTNKYEPVYEVVDGTGAPVPLTSDENVIDKAFDAETKKTVPELRAKAEGAKFYDEWVAKYQDQPRLNKVKTSNLVLKRGASNTNAAGTTTQAPAGNLFG